MSSSSTFDKKQLVQTLRSKIKGIEAELREIEDGTYERIENYDDCFDIDEELLRAKKSAFEEILEELKVDAV